MINEVSAKVGLDLVQLSGKELITVADSIKLPCLKAVHVDSQSPSAVDQISSAASDCVGHNVSALLLDTFDPHVRGGTGRAFDWSIARRAQRELLPIVLAGGLNIQNIGSAVQTVEPFAVDVSSGVETDGTKDLGKICKFISLAKNPPKSSEETGEMALYLYGSPIGHSPSPMMHNAGLKALKMDNRFKYHLFENMDIKQVALSLRDVTTAGGNVTIPHKQNIMPFLDQISEEARAVGAVNTVSKSSDGLLIGHNTDWLAIYELTKRCLMELRPTQSNDAGKLVGLVIGAGGTAHAACYALSRLNAEFYIYNRTPERAQQLAKKFAGVQGIITSEDQLAELASSVDIVISTVPPSSQFTLPQRFFSSDDGDVRPEDKGLVVVELVYHPRYTPLLEQVRQHRQQQQEGRKGGRRVAVVEGIEVLVAQGLAGFEIWTGCQAPRCEMAGQLLTTFKEGLYGSPPPSSLAF